MKSVLVWATLLLAGSGSAQSWFPEGATWQHEYWNVGAFIGFTRMVVDGDTIVGGEQAQVLRRERVAAFVLPPHNWDVETRFPIIVQESDGLVNVWEGGRNRFAVLYNMNALPDEQWTMPVLYDWNVCDTTSFVQVVDTGTMVVDDVSLRWLAVERHYIFDGEEWNVFADTVIERIGFTTGYFAPHDACNAMVDGDEGLELRCYTDDEISYKLIQPWSCETLLAVPDRTGPNARLTVWPNPGGDALHLDRAGHRLSSLELRDALGRTVLERTSLLNNNPIDVSSLAPGTYVVLARTAQGERLVANWVKQ